MIIATMLNAIICVLISSLVNLGSFINIPISCYGIAERKQSQTHEFEMLQTEWQPDNSD